MSTTLLHVGIDPASQLVGICTINHDGLAIRPIEGFHGDKHYLHQTISGGSNRDVHLRLEKIQDQLRTYFYDTIPTHMFAIGIKEWHIVSIGIENPAMTTYVQEGKATNRFDTTFVLGRAFEAVMVVAHEVRRTLDIDIIINEVRPLDSSVSLGLGSRASKKARNRRCAEIEHGVLIEKDEKKSDGDYVQGGNLHSAGPDALDAFAAAYASRKLYIEHRLAQQANDAAKKERKGHVRQKPIKSPIRRAA